MRSGGQALIICLFGFGGRAATYLGPEYGHRQDTSGISSSPDERGGAADHRVLDPDAVHGEEILGEMHRVEELQV